MIRKHLHFCGRASVAELTLASWMLCAYMYREEVFENCWLRIFFGVWCRNCNALLYVIYFALLVF